MFFLPLFFLGHGFGLIPASGSFAASAFPVPPLTAFGFPPIKRPLAWEAEATRFWVAPRKWGKKKEKIQSWLTFSSVPTLCEQNQLVTGNGLNLFADRLCK